MTTKTTAIDKYNFTTAEGRAEFIANTPSGIYTGKNEDGEEVAIFLDQGKGMTVKTQHASKPRWWECVGYDQDGWQEDVTYEPYTG